MNRNRLFWLVAIATLLVLVAVTSTKAATGSVCPVPLRWYGAQYVWFLDRTGGTVFDQHEAVVYLHHGRYRVEWSTGRTAHLRVNGACKVRWSG